MADYQPEWPGIVDTVGIISCLTRRDIEWGARAYRLWRERPELSVCQCVDIAAKELYISSSKRLPLPNNGPKRLEGVCSEEDLF